MNEYDRPVLAFYPEDECSNDSSNWFGPNRAAVEAMLRVVGFRKIELVSSTSGLLRGYVRGAGKSLGGRMVFHAWK
jgi:hypothetical protein